MVPRMELHGNIRFIEWNQTMTWAKHIGHVKAKVHYHKNETKIKLRQTFNEIVERVLELQTEMLVFRTEALFWKFGGARLVRPKSLVTGPTTRTCLQWLHKSKINKTGTSQVGAIS